VTVAAEPVALTPSQTVGPFHHIELPYAAGGHVVPPGSDGAVRITGRLVDGEGQPVGDALIEVWQADASGSYQHAADPVPTGATSGFGRIATAADGSYELWTVKPGRVPGPDGSTQAPHILVSVFARGLLDRLVTRMYFPDEADANAADPVLALVPDAEARSTLVAKTDDTADDDGLRFDIHLQGERETVFFAV
jgi:protocatechuate 3,4-dioxygenase, alpha subunit